MSAPIISSRSATNISAIPPSRWRRSRAIRSIGAPRTAPRTGRPPTIFRPCATRKWCWKNFRSAISASMQAFAFNIRRDKFKDARVRRAFNFAFDFEEMNRTIFFGQYKRIASYFEGTELASSGIPEGQELEILQSVKDKVPADLFSKPYTNPVGGNPQAVRDNLARGARAVSRGRLRDPQHQAGQRQDRRAVQRRVPGRGPGHRALRAVLQALAATRRHDGERARGRLRAIREPAAAMGFRHHRRVLGPVAVARQRAARLSGARRPPIFPARAT